MEQKNFGYSMKNIPQSSKKSYIKRFVEKMSSLFERMRWAVIHYENKHAGNQKETYGFKTSKCPEPQTKLAGFENDMQELVRNIKFRKYKSSFQKKLKNDVREIQKSNGIYVHADKSTNVYIISKDEYQKKLDENVTKTYKKATDHLKNAIDSEGSTIATKLELADRMEVYAERQPFITLKDHKPNFISKPTCRLINPAKSEIGIVSQKILKRINSRLRLATKYNQWQDTSEAIEWFKQRPNKKSSTCIEFDIESFYPSITEETLLKALQWARSIVDIDPSEEEIIFHSRRSLLFKGKSSWIKKDGSDFDVTMGSYDGAEICELVGLYMLHLLSQKFNSDTVGLYRDDGQMVDVFTPQKADRARKNIIKIFKSCGFSITISIMLPRYNFLDVTFDLPSERYWPYRKPNNDPLYVNSQSNHPPVVLKHLPNNITERLSKISCDKDEFDKSKPDYQKALSNSGYNIKMSFVEPKKKKKRRKPRNNIIWFNPPYDQCVSTDIGRKYLQLIDRHFPENHPYHSLFNRNTMKLSYSCMGNMGSIISGHNKKILNASEEPAPSKTCNCRNPANCPLDGECLAESVVYKATVSVANKPTKVYYGLTEPQFKTRWNNHKSSFKIPKRRNETELSKYIWDLRENDGVSDKDIHLKWSIHQKCPKYKCGTRRCDLCISEKATILMADKASLLNKRSEIVSTCRHRLKFRYDHVKKRP